MKHDVILLSGKQGSGKSTLARALQTELNERKGVRAVRMSFAAPLYRIHDFARGILKSAGIPFPPGTEEKDGYLLQLLGTEWGRERVDQDVWVKIAQADVVQSAALARNAFEHMVFIFDDCRFPNELTAFPGAITVRLNAPEDLRRGRASMWRESTGHASETALDDSEDWALVLNTAAYTPEECVRYILARLDAV